MKGRRIIRRLFPVLLAGALSVETSLGQESTGRIMGNVTDQTGAAVGGAKITATKVGTETKRSMATDKYGFYQLLSLPVGAYKVMIEMSGFRRQVFEHQALQINQSLRLDARLVIGQASEVIQVTDQAANVETVNQTIGASIAGETIQRAPLNGRDVLDLAALLPGVIETDDDSIAAGRHSIAGGRSDSVTFVLDGALNNRLRDNSVVYDPNPDTIAEFHLLESNYSAEYGRNGGGVISVVTKSGTNAWHGSAFEFLRNDAFNANTFFNNAERLPRDVLKRHQYGGTLGGPIRKDKFFFFVGYQGQRLSTQATHGVGPVYTPAELQKGDFSTAAANGGADPGVACFLSGLWHNTGDPKRPDGAPCGTPASTYFQSDSTKAYNAIIDPTKFDAAAQNYIRAGLIPTDPTGQHDYRDASTDNYNELTVKFDFVVTQNDKLAVTLGGRREPQLKPFWFATVPGYSSARTDNPYFASAGYSRSLSPNLLNQFTVFIQRTTVVKNLPVGPFKSNTATSLGMGVTPDQSTGPPDLAFDNGLSIGYSENGPTTEIDNTFGSTEALTYIHGRHNWKMGTGISAYQNNTHYDYIVNGEWDFNGSSGSGSGNALADFLLGIPSQYLQGAAAPSNIRSKSYYGYLQDEWRIARNFSLNWGVRYEYSSPKLDTRGRTFSVIPGVTTPSRVFINAPIGMLFPGDPNAPRGVNYPDRDNFAPRVGFAWDPQGNGRSSLRGGFGVFYDILSGEENIPFNGAPPFFSSVGLYFPTVSGDISPVGYFQKPFASTNPPTVNPFPSHIPPPNIDFGASGFLPINASGGILVDDPHLHTPYIYQFNLSLQRELANNLVFETSYVGSVSHGLTSLLDINPFVLGTTDRILNLTPGNSSCVDASGNSTSGVSPKAVCSFDNLSEFKNVSHASYRSLQASLSRQLAESRYIGLGRAYFTLGYTLSHNIDNVSGYKQRNSTVPAYHPGLFRADSDQDVRQRITFSGGWDLPCEKLWRSGPKRLTKGWSLFPIFTWHTGFPYDVFAGLGGQFNPQAEGPSGAGDPYLVHANVVGSLETLDPHRFQNIGSNLGYFWINPNSFSRAQCGDGNHPAPCTPGPTVFPSNNQIVANSRLATYGTLPRNYLRGPGLVNLDLALSKTTALSGERASLEFRAEFFNTFNHANFMNPNTSITSPQFGQIIATRDPRIIQLAARLTF